MFTTLDKSIAGFAVSWLANECMTYFHVALPADLQTALAALIVAVLVWVTPNVEKAISKQASGTSSASSIKPVVILAVIILGALALPLSGHAQTRTRHVPAITGNPVEDIKTDLQGGVAVPAGQTGTQAIQTQLQQLEAKFNGQVLADLQNALALAQQKDANGQTADATAVPCYQALISLTNLVQGLSVPAPTPPAAGATAPATPPPATGPQVITQLEKLRIVKNALSSQAFKDACAPLVQDVQSSGNQLLASVLGIVGGAAKLGVTIP